METELVDQEMDFKKMLRPRKTIRLAASGPVMITEIERQVIDTDVFQRLRQIRQLGMAYLVYPTATHTRFEHSLGTLQMVGEMVRSIRENDHNEDHERSISHREETLIRLYALLHDVTHIPFGHSVEDELRLLTRHDENDDRIDHFLGPKSRIGRIVSKEYGHDFLQDLLAIYTWDDDEKKRTHTKIVDELGLIHEIERPKRKAVDPELLYIHDLVSNTLCADLLDYLRRDRAACDFVAPREYWFLNFLYIHTNSETKERRICLRLWKGGSHGQDGAGIPRRDLLSDLCGLLEERYKLAERVYFHHAKVIATAMIGRAIQEAKDSGLVSEEKMRMYGDDTLVYLLGENGNPVAKNLIVSLKQRKLHQRLAELTDSAFNAVQVAEEGRNVKEFAEKLVATPEERRALEDRIAEFINCQPGDILIYAPGRKMNEKVAMMKVFYNGEIKTLSNIKDPLVSGQLKLILDAHGALWSIQLLAKRGLSPGAKKDAIDIFKTELLSGAALREEKYQEIETRKIRHELKKREKQPQMELAEFDKKIERIRNQVFSLNKSSSRKSANSQSLLGQINAAIDIEFPNTKPVGPK